ncbi:MAG TPA: group I intron-associated PD-(D/E)XK endonuclease [Terriglobales bacterium]|nr:group I intron-associated PD-(D/E)XK endonuclease [Terriglobales bacterium]
MRRWEKLLHPFMRSTKRRGEWAEAAFVAKALGQGLRVSKPLGDSDPYDYVVFNIRHAMNRVQVKSAWARRMGRGYEVRSTNQKLDRRDFDFLVVALPEVDVWYVIPVDAVHGKRNARLYPVERRRRKTRCDYEQYREAWHLLTGDEPGAWARYQRFTIHAGTE